MLCSQPLILIVGIHDLLSVAIQHVPAARSDPNAVFSHLYSRMSHERSMHAQNTVQILSSVYALVGGWHLHIRPSCSLACLWSNRPLIDPLCHRKRLR
jgi:hypothetical protein